LFNAGISMAARIAMMAMTTSSSIRVKARRKFTIANNKPKQDWFQTFLSDPGKRIRPLPPNTYRRPESSG
jgi:hypothetical protein